MLYKESNRYLFWDPCKTHKWTMMEEYKTYES